MIITGKAFSGLHRMRTARPIEGHDKFLDAREGVGASAAFAKHIRDTRAAIAQDPQRGYTKDKSLRLVAMLPTEIYCYHEMMTPGCWNDDGFVKGILDDMPDCIVNPSTKTAKGLKSQRAR